ncbi:MAG: hypothetical protein AAB967_04360, partial [Patescibacteria group bacterium]
ESQNALLKVSEDPPPSALIILVMSDPEAIRETVSSRFQKIYFSPVSRARIASWLQRDFGVAKEKSDMLAARSFGAPGRALALLRDARFQALHAAARKFRSLPAGAHRAFVKDLIAPEDFRFEAFLDALIAALAAEGKKDPALWHRVLRIRRESEYFNLNPRLQLEALVNQSAKIKG